MKNLINKRNQSGYTMLEVLVAMTLGIVVLAAAVGMQISHRAGFKMSESKLSMQTNAKFAFEFIARQLRESASLGCRTAENYLGDGGDSSGNINIAFNNPAVAYANFQPGFEIEGYENNEGAGTWTPTPSSAFSFPADMENGSDAITVRGAIGETYLVDTNGVQDGASSITLDMTGVTDVKLKQNFYVVVSGCNNANIFKLTNSTAAIQGGVLARDAGGGADDNNASTFSENEEISVFDDQLAEVRRVAVTTFYVANDPNTVDLTNPQGVPTLYRDVDGQSSALVAGVERMQVEYGIDSETDTQRHVPVQYQTADQVADWSSVVSARISFIMRSKEAVYQNDVSPPKTLHGVQTYVHPQPGDEDQFSRLVYTSTVTLRNRLIGDRT